MRSKRNALQGICNPGDWEILNRITSVFTSTDEMQGPAGHCRLFAKSHPIFTCLRIPPHHQLVRLLTIGHLQRQEFMRGTIRRNYRALIRTAGLLYLILFCAAFLKSFIGVEEMREGFHLPPWMLRILTDIGAEGLPVLMILDRDAERNEDRERGREIEEHPPHGACGAGVRDRQP